MTQYTFRDMTTARENGGFAIINEDNQPVISIYDFDARKWLDGTFDLDTDTMIATKRGGRKTITVDADLDQGIWFAA